MSKQLEVTDSFGNVLPVYSLDFETYFDIKEYSLSKMTTIEYVRDARFKAHGCGVIYPDGFESWITHRDLLAFFDSIDWSKAAVLVHHGNFDGFIMSEIYGKIPAYYLDTMGMSRGEFGVGVPASLDALSKRLGYAGKIEGELIKTSGIRDLTATQEGALVPYAIQDVEQMKLSFENLYFERGFPEQELHIIDLTVRTFTRPLLRMNAALCRAEIEAEDIRIKRLLESDILGDVELSDECAKKVRTGGITDLMRSRPCFAELLRSRGVEPPLKERMSKGAIVPGAYTYAFAKNDAALISLGDDPRVSDLVAVWTGLKSTLRKTRAERFLRVTHDGTKSFPVPLVYCGGRTFRWSGCVTGDTRVTILRNADMQQVLIGDVRKSDLVWDGEDFVQHKGVVYSGIQEVITHDGITATRDHGVFIDGERLTTLLEAKARGYGIEARTAPSSTWLEANRQRLVQNQRQNTSSLLALRRSEDRAGSGFFAGRQALLPQVCGPSSNAEAIKCDASNARAMYITWFNGEGIPASTPSTYECKRALHEQKRVGLEKLRRTRNNFWVRFYTECHKMGISESWLATIGTVLGQNRQRPGVQAGQLALGHTETAVTEPTERRAWPGLQGQRIWNTSTKSISSTPRLYVRGAKEVHQTRMDGRTDTSNGETAKRQAPTFDILDCGPKHRFVANDRLIKNSDSLNPQNLNAGRDGRGSRLREAITAPDGYMMVDIDLAQIELRVSAWLANEVELLDDLRLGRDPYSKLATEIFGVPVSKTNENKHLRHIGKEGELSLGFGVGWVKFLNTIQTKYGFSSDVFSEEQAQATVALYRKKRTGIVQTWNEIKEFIPQMAGKVIPKGGFPYKGILRIENERVMMPNKLHMQYRDIHWNYDKEKKQGEYVYRHKKDWTRIYPAKMYENWIQCLARIIVADQAVEIAKRYPVVLLVHDQIMSLAKEDEAEEALAWSLETMKQAPAWCSDIPLDAEGHISRNYVK